MSQATPGSSPVAGSTPTVVLVHGAFADTSGWCPGSFPSCRRKEFPRLRQQIRSSRIR